MKIQKLIYGKAVIKVSFNNTNLYLNWTKDNTNSASQNGYDVKNPSFDQTPGQKYFLLI